MDIVDPNQDPAARFAERRNAFLKDMNALVEVVDTQSPFYPEPIFKALEQVLVVARREEMQVRVIGPDRNRPGAWEVEGHGRTS